MYRPSLLVRLKLADLSLSHTAKERVYLAHPLRHDVDVPMPLFQFLGGPAGETIYN